MARKWEDAAKYAGTGAAVGGTVGSVIPVIGTAVGAAAGTVIGGVSGFIGGTIADDNRAEDQAREAEKLKAQQAKQRKAAYRDYWLAEANALSGNAALARAQNYNAQVQSIKDGQGAQREAMNAAHAAQNETSPDAFVGLANAGARVGQAAYNQYHTPSAASAPSAMGSGGGMGGTVNPANLTGIAPPQYTPSKIADPSLSPEVQSEFDAENLKPLRLGRREGFA